MHGDGWLWFSGPVEERAAERPDDVPAVLAWAERAALEGAWCVGFVAYEAATAFDPALVVRPPRKGLPFAVFRRYPSGPTFWNELDGGESPDAARWEAEWDERAYADAFAEVRRALAAGESYQVNLTFRLRSQGVKGTGLFARAAGDDPPPYAAYFGGATVGVVCLSPELFFERCGTEIVGRPMKGTSRADAAAGELDGSDKERAENLMVVDMIRNDLGRIARTGSVTVPALFTVERHGALHQMTSTIRAESDAPLVEVFRALFPCASIVGAPKVATTRLIARLEPSPRGVYTGALGFLAPGGDARFAVAIRTATFFPRDRSVEYGVGSGVVWDSGAAAEWEECRLKRSVLERTDPPWELLETMRFDPGEGVYLRDRHLARIARSAADFAVPFSREAVEWWLDRHVAELTETKRLRLRLGRDGSLALDVLPMRTAVATLTAAWAQSPVASGDRALGYKSTFRGRYERRRAEVPTDEVLLWNERGEATEFANGSLIVDIAGRRVTPPVPSGCLPGTYVAELLDRGALVARPVRRREVEAAERLWFANSVVGEVPVRLIAQDQGGGTPRP